MKKKQQVILGKEKKPPRKKNSGRGGAVRCAQIREGKPLHTRFTPEDGISRTNKRHYPFEAVSTTTPTSPDPLRLFQTKSPDTKLTLALHCQGMQPTYHRLAVEEEVHVLNSVRVIGG